MSPTQQTAPRYQSCLLITTFVLLLLATHTLAFSEIPALAAGAPHWSLWK